MLCDDACVDACMYGGVQTCTYIRLCLSLLASTLIAYLHFNFVLALMPIHACACDYTHTPTSTWYLLAFSVFFERLRVLIWGNIVNRAYGMHKKLPAIHLTIFSNSIWSY